MVDTEQIERCTTAGIEVQQHLQHLTNAIDDGTGEAARHYLASVLVDAGAMHSCGIEFDRGEVERLAWELMPLISSGVTDEAEAIDKTALISLELIDTTPSNLEQLVLDHGLQ